MLLKKVSRLERGSSGSESVIDSSDEDYHRHWVFWVGKMQERFLGVSTNCFSPYLRIYFALFPVQVTSVLKLNSVLYVPSSLQMAVSTHMV